MTMDKNDWQRLQWSIVLFVALALTGAGIVAIATKSFNEAVKTNQNSKQASDAARSKASRAREDAQHLSEQIGTYEQMQKRGIIGQEHRLDWIEKIRKIKQERKLIDVNYELEPQQLLDAKADHQAAAVAAPNSNGLDFMSSPMKLQMALLHENDLLDFLADLRAGVQGYIRVSKCDISRASVAATEHGPTAQLHADCDLQWITLRELLP